MQCPVLTFFHNECKSTHGQSVSEDAAVSQPAQPDHHRGNVDEETAEDHHEYKAKTDEKVCDGHNTHKRTEEERHGRGTQSGHDKTQVEDEKLDNVDLEAWGKQRKEGLEIRMNI